MLTRDHWDNPEICTIYGYLINVFPEIKIAYEDRFLLGFYEVYKFTDVSEEFIPYTFKAGE
jgi:hypothetical protein